MCQTATITNSITSINKKSFNQRIQIIVCPEKSSKSQYTRLNNMLDSLYEELYDSYPTITENDYAIIRPQLNLLLSTLKEIARCLSSVNTTYKKDLADNICRLNSNINALEELDSDIINFKIEIFKNKRYQEIISKAKELR